MVGDMFWVQTSAIAGSILEQIPSKSNQHDFLYSWKTHCFCDHVTGKDSGVVVVRTLDFQITYLLLHLIQASSFG